MSCKRKLTGHQVAETGYFNSLNGIISRIDYQTGNKSQTLLWGKVGNYYSLARAGEHFAAGNHEKGNQALISFGVGWTAGELTAMGVARFALVGAAGTASWPAILAGVVVGSAVSLAIDYYFSNKDCDPDPTEDFKPNKDESPTQYYKKEYYDPIILDLDGNGVGTVAKFGYHGAMFDHNGDGIATATGWVDKSDGLLVRDVNANGKIDNGSELFGDSTLLQNGQKAGSGMEALADLDDNKDGVIDTNDKAFGELKVWQDKNGDGISGDGEILTFSSLGIERIDLTNKEAMNKVVEGGVIKDKVRFVKTDGSVHTLADVNFEADGIHTRHLNKVALNDTIKALPSVYGMGRLADIQQSAMQSNALASLLAQYTNANSRTAQKALLDELMNTWAKTDRQYTNADIQIITKENIQWIEIPSDTNTTDGNDSSSSVGSSSSGSSGGGTGTINHYQAG